MSRRVRVLAVTSIAALVLAAAVARHVTRGRNGLGVRTVVLVTLDTTRADRLGCYGSTRGTTPRIDALAESGVRFERCLTTAPITLPAHASILSGSDPIAHGVRINGAFALDPATPTLATVLRAEGFRTGAFVSAFVLDRRFGLDAGFDVYDDAFGESGGNAGDLGPEERRGARTVERALRFVDEAGSAPLFLWVHLFDPHAPYAAPQDFAARFEDPYDAELAYADHCVGQLLDGLAARGRLDDALVALTADHGEGLGDHGESTHTVFVYDSTLHVPLIVASKGRLPAGKVLRSTLSTASIAPTLLDLLAIEKPPTMYPPSAAAWIQGEEPEHAPAVRFESLTAEYYYGFAPLFGIEEDGAKLIVAPRPELYVPREDPGETTDRIGAEPERATALKRALDRYEQEHGGAHARVYQLDEHEEQALAALGYVGRGGRQKSGRDPKDGIVVVEALQQAALLSARDPAAAEATLRALVAREPGVAEAFEMLGNLCGQAGPGRRDDAVDAYRAAVRLRPQDPVLLTSLGAALLRAEHREEARRVLRTAITLDGGYLRAKVFLAGIEEAVDRAAALRLYNDVLDRAPHLIAARSGRARCLLADGNARLADQDLERALADEPARADLWLLRAQIQDKVLANPDLARTLYERALQGPLDPDAARAARARVLELAGS